MRAAPWYVEAFSEAYLDVYPHRDERSAAREARGTLNLLRHEGTRGRLLDLASGTGRHARALKLLRRALTPVTHAARIPSPTGEQGLPTVRGDMRRVPLA